MVSSRCQGDITISTKADRSMVEFLEAEAERCGVSRAELIRRIFDDFRDSRREQLGCPSCGQKVVLNPCP